MPLVSDEQKNEFKEMVSSGKYSYAEVARYFGLTRNSAIGYANRLGVSNGKVRGKSEKPVVEKRANAARLAAWREKKRQEAALEAGRFKATEVTEDEIVKVVRERVVYPYAMCFDCLRSSGCRWPVRGGPMHQFCGAPVVGDNGHGREVNYCAPHYRASLRKNEYAQATEETKS